PLPTLRRPSERRGRWVLPTLEGATPGLGPCLVAGPGVQQLLGRGGTGEIGVVVDEHVRPVPERPGCPPRQPGRARQTGRVQQSGGLRAVMLPAQQVQVLDLSEAAALRGPVVVLLDVI